MIDRIYRTVLSILNKEQRGYITPTEFNEFAQQAQIEIFENYFYDLGRALNVHGVMMDMFSNIPDHVMEKLRIFRVDSNPIPVLNGVVTLPDNLYRLAEVFSNNRIVDMVSHKMINYVLLSPLTAPTVTQPVYTRTGNRLNVYPTDLVEVTLEYIRELETIPQWTGTTVNGELVFNATTSVDFELHPQEEHELVVKILQLAGVSVRAGDIAQGAAGKDQSITQEEQ